MSIPVTRVYRGRLAIGFKWEETKSNFILNNISDQVSCVKGKGFIPNIFGYDVATWCSPGNIVYSFISLFRRCKHKFSPFYQKVPGAFGKMKKRAKL